MKNNTRYCHDTSIVRLHLGTCYRELPLDTVFPDFWLEPFGEHCRYWNGELYSWHTDLVSPVLARDESGNSVFGTCTSIIHTCTDVPTIPIRWWITCTTLPGPSEDECTRDNYDLRPFIPDWLEDLLDGDWLI